LQTTAKGLPDHFVGRYISRAYILIVKAKKFVNVLPFKGCLVLNLHGFWCHEHWSQIYFFVCSFIQDPSS